MDDDFNTALAIANMFDLSKEINIYYNEVTSGKVACSKIAVDTALDVFSEMADIIGILEDDDNSADDGLVDNLMNLIIDIRQNARKNKDWATADKIRDELKKKYRYYIRRFSYWCSLEKKNNEIQTISIFKTTSF